MARKHRRAKSSVLTTPTGTAPGAQPLGFVLATNGYDGAATTDKRTYVYFPELDTKKELNSYTRTELMRRARAFEKNVGIARRALGGAAGLVGYLVPRPATADTEWNRAAARAFARRALSARIFDVSGKVDFEEAQLFIRKQVWRDGDMLTVKAKSQAGGARFAFYESQQIRQPANPKPGWVDGIYFDRLNRPYAYHLANPGSEDNGTRILAEECIYSAHWENLGGLRGSSALVAALNNIHDITDIRSLYKHNIKVSSLLGLVKEKKEDNDRATGLVGAKRSQSVTLGGTESTFSWESVMSGGQIPNLPPGQTLRTISDNRPAPEQMALIAHLIRDIAWSLDLSPEILWDIAGLPGPAVRYVMAELNRWVRRQQKPLRAWARQVWAHTIAGEMEAGRLASCRDPEWWQVDWIGQADLSIDKGRDGNLMLNFLDAGATTLQDWYAATEGLSDYRPKIDQRIDEVAYAMERCEAAGIPYERVFPPRQGAAVAPAGAPRPVTPEPDDDPDPGPGEED